MIENIVTDLTLEDLLRGKWLNEKDRVIISNNELECVRVGKSESLGQMQLVAVLVTGQIQPGPIIDADCVDDQRISLPLSYRISVPRRIVPGIRRMIAAIGVDQAKDMLRLAEDRNDIRALNNHAGMRSRCHSRRPRRQTLRIGILGMIDLLISLGCIGCQNELLSGQRVL